MDTRPFYTGGLLGEPHQDGRKTALRHHHDARTLWPRTFLNMVFWLWYFWVGTHENRLDVIPFARIPRRARGARRWRTRSRAPADALSDGYGRRRDRGPPAGG